MSRPAKQPIEARLLRLLHKTRRGHGYSRSMLHGVLAGYGPGEVVRARESLIARGLAVERKESKPHFPRMAHYLYAVSNDTLACEVRAIVLGCLLREER